MRVPEEFNDFCSEFDCIQVFMDLDDGSMEKAIKRAIRSLNKHQALVVKQFLDKTIASVSGQQDRKKAKIS